MHRVTSMDPQSFGAATGDFQDVARRSRRRIDRALPWWEARRDVFLDIDDPSGSIHKDHIEWNQGIEHPEGARGSLGS